MAAKTFDEWWYNTISFESVPDTVTRGDCARHVKTTAYMAWKAATKATVEKFTSHNKRVTARKPRPKSPKKATS